ncbi:MAG TPA: TetR/AcrR family transcriptional regulator [Candidatus Kryptonia bacterium]|nr:TetR/AcrR family transcriptional regulator [Candidatus Kryptonia bacterium]
MKSPVIRQPREEARRARTDLYRQHIFEVAEKVFADRGFETAKVQEISALAGLSMGTIYAIFPSKDDLLRAILEARGEELLQLVHDVTARHVPPRAALSNLADAYIGYFVNRPDFLRMHLRVGTAWVLSPSPGNDTRVQLWQDIHKLQADIFRRGVAAGVFIDEDPGYLAKLFSAMDQVVLSDWVSTGMRADRGKLVDRLQRLVERTFCVSSPKMPRKVRS